ncbi:hypothetical protein RHSIM_RhsimUnG0114200 [Rhododendron simsii]|uniref:H(+)-exporting diphosphatase n=1 Tax=Rhododendron simsii TaxID=118357 RepID=A0A834FVM3_RHOSS|nr:hypothetical protein RHSIM_RhsimUnG0114200 [Rhododendron simsii]
MADNDGDIAGMGYDLFGPHAKSTCAALVFGSISSFGINYNCNVLTLLISSAEDRIDAVISLLSSRTGHPEIFQILEKLSFKDFENLVSLEKLHISFCPKLTSISELRLPPSLSELQIFDCPSLALKLIQVLAYVSANPQDDLAQEFSTLLRRFIASEQGEIPSSRALPNDKKTPETSDMPGRHLQQMDSAQRAGIVLITEPECACLLIPVLSSAQYLSCLVLSFQRGSGGIHAKAADVGADIIDNVERNIPHDDPRIERFIPLSILVILHYLLLNYWFLLFDIVGEIAGMGYDLVGFYAEPSCAALVFGSISSFGINHNCNALSFAR